MIKIKNDKNANDGRKNTALRTTNEQHEPSKTQGVKSSSGPEGQACPASLVTSVVLLLLKARW